MYDQSCGQVLHYWLCKNLKGSLKYFEQCTSLYIHISRELLHLNDHFFRVSLYSCGIKGFSLITCTLSFKCITSSAHLDLNPCTQRLALPFLLIRTYHIRRCFEVVYQRGCNEDSRDPQSWSFATKPCRKLGIAWRLVCPRESLWCSHVFLAALDLPSRSVLVLVVLQLWSPYSHMCVLASRPEIATGNIYLHWSGL